jgi:hypothetical protein
LKWPELLEFPFNEPFGWLKLQAQARKALAKVRRAVGNGGTQKA